MLEGHADASEVVPEPPDIAALLSAARSSYQASLLATAQARQQFDLGLEAVRLQAEQGRRALEPEDLDISRFVEAWRQYGEPAGPPADAPAPHRNLEDLAQAWRATYARCSAELERFCHEHDAWAATRPRLLRRRPAEPRLPQSFQTDVNALRSMGKAVPGARSTYVDAVEGAAATTLRSTFEAEAAVRERHLTDALRRDLAAVQEGVELLGVSGQPWERRLREPVELSSRPGGAACLGVISSGLPAPYSVHVPCMIPFPATRGLAIAAATGSRQRAVELLRSVLLRVLLDVPPGQLRLSLIDPMAMGQSFSDFLHLGDGDERLVGGGVKTSAESIERCLAEHVAHVQVVVSKYLRGQFQDIHEYNRSAGEMAEPYRLVVVMDYPQQFSDRAAEHLLSLVQNGPRCGVHVLLLHDPEDGGPCGVPFARLTQSTQVVTVQGEMAQLKAGPSRPPVDFTPDRCPPIAFDVDGRALTQAAQVLEILSRAARSEADAVVTLDRFLPAVSRNRTGPSPDFEPDASPLGLAPESWWTAGTSKSAVAPIGRVGAQGVASLSFSSTAVAGGAIMVGLPRSGKTTSLHAMILTMAMLYSPEELELYLIDAKHGVEFKAYEHLPHARMVSVHSEREFSLAVLKSIQAKIKERAQLIKGHGGGLSNLTEYRRATSERLPRIIVVVDEFHELFEEADRIGLEAFAAFSDIVRMGPFSGTHIVVASQTLSSMPAMDRQTLLLLPQRVAFMCNEYDAEIVMGESNGAARMLSKTGEGLFNPLRGDESKNQLFQGLYVTPEERGHLLEALRHKADACGWTRHPRVFDGDAVVARPPVVAVPPGRRFAAPIGEPFTLADSESIVLPRTRGSNLLVLGARDDDTPDLSVRGALHSVLVAAHEQGAAATVVDFTGDEDTEHGLSLMEAAAATGSTYVRSSSLEPVLQEVSASVAARTVERSYREPTSLLLLCGVQRALSLAPLDPYSVDRSGEPSLVQLLSAIVVSGPEVGVHVVVAADGSRSVEARLGHELLGEFMVRLAGSAAEAKDLSFVSGSYGDLAPLRHGQVLVGDLLRGSMRRVRGYGPLTAAPTGGDEGSAGDG